MKKICNLIILLLGVCLNANAQTSNLPCAGATSEANTANGICIGCYVSNSGGAIDYDTSTASNLYVNPGLTGGYAQQTLIFPTVVSTDYVVVIKLVTSSAVSNISDLGKIQIACYSSNNSVATISTTGQITILGVGSTTISIDENNIQAQTCPLTIASSGGEAGGIKMLPNPATPGSVATAICNFSLADLHKSRLIIVDMRYNGQKSTCKILVVNNH